jgi:2,3-bisphosphoglycerate-independent phosphoglycerate mutase
MFDEYIPPLVMAGYNGVQAGDVILHTNYRQDRATQLTRAFVDKDYPGEAVKVPDVLYAGMTRYYDGFDNFLLMAAGKADTAPLLTVGKVISDAGLYQLRIAETQKFPHVTSFFNGKLTTPYPREDRIELKGRFDPASFAEHPEMEAYRVTEALLKELQRDKYAFIMVNYANGDMVGHTGNFESGVRAVEILDENLGKIIPAILEKGGRVLLTADHGNVDQMLDYETGAVRTSHSLNPVDLFYITAEPNPETRLEDGVLSDIGVTILKLLQLDIPVEMDARILIQPLK